MPIRTTMPFTQKLSKMEPLTSHASISYLRAKRKEEKVLTNTVDNYSLKKMCHTIGFFRETAEDEVFISIYGVSLTSGFSQSNKSAYFVP